jgi:hypothetical protein
VGLLATIVGFLAGSGVAKAASVVTVDVTGVAVGAAVTSPFVFLGDFVLGIVKYSLQTPKFRNDWIG